jgi:uncharacterized protein (TIGR03435 family)
VERINLRTLTALIGLAGTMFNAFPLLSEDLAFEVATIKPTNGKPNRSTFPSLRNGRFTAENVTLKTLLSVAFGLSGLRINGPEWIDADRFDLAAKAPQGVPDSELKPMLQALLRERFQVTVHREQKEMPTFDLMPAKGGIKLLPFDPAHPPATPRNIGGSLWIGAATMPQIADGLAMIVGRPVVDRTGIDGRYSFTVHYAPPSRTLNDPAETAIMPDIFTAVPEQMGLKLESKKQEIEILVIDSATRTPVAN